MKTGKGSRYVEVPRHAIEARLQAAGFTAGQHYGELTYDREVTTPHGKPVFVRVYTSVRVDRETARGCGKDAIRVALVFQHEDKWHGISSEQRVFRTGTVDGVLERMVERMRAAWVEARSLRRCGKCSAPAYADSGRCVVRQCRDGGKRWN